MTDILHYRVPNQGKIKEKGVFKKVNSFQSVEGFILSSFLKEEKFVFEKNAETNDRDFIRHSPYCLSENEYLTQATSFLEELKKKKIAKAIFSRVKELAIYHSAEELFDKLCSQYPNAFVYLISSSCFGSWIGASPEILLTVDGYEAETIALAGTMRTTDSSLWRGKEIEEQQLVTDFISNKLSGLEVENRVQFPREELIAGSIKHLSTRFKFRTQFELQEKIIDTLHPTPAVSGSPQKKAIELIGKYEKHNRSLYAISKEETQLFVNLRCAQLIDNKAYLYIGGGFTKKSNIRDEWLETESKAETLQKVFQKK